MWAAACQSKKAASRAAKGLSVGKRATALGYAANARVINAVLSRDANITCADGGKSGFTDGCLRASILKLSKTGCSRAACGLLSCANLPGKWLGVIRCSRNVCSCGWGV